MVVSRRLHFVRLPAREVEVATTATRLLATTEVVTPRVSFTVGVVSELNAELVLFPSGPSSGALLGIPCAAAVHPVVVEEPRKLGVLCELLLEDDEEEDGETQEERRRRRRRPRRMIIGTAHIDGALGKCTVRMRVPEDVLNAGGGGRSASFQITLSAIDPSTGRPADPLTILPVTSPIINVIAAKEPSMTAAVALPYCERHLKIGTLPDIRIREEYGATIGSHLWNGGLVMAHYLAGGDGRSRFPLRGRRVLELGSGCGLVGIVAACCGASDVLMTDRPDTTRILRLNIEQNRTAIDAAGGRIPRACELEWGGADAVDAAIGDDARQQLDLILATDVLYYPGCHAVLAQTLHALCCRGPDSGPTTTVLIAHNHRGCESIPAASDASPPPEIGFLSHVTERFDVQRLLVSGSATVEIFSLTPKRREGGYCF